MAIFIYPIANTLNNKKTAKAADPIIYYSMLNRKTWERKIRLDHLETLLGYNSIKVPFIIQQFKYWQWNKPFFFTLHLWKTGKREGNEKETLWKSKIKQRHFTSMNKSMTNSSHGDDGKTEAVSLAPHKTMFKKKQPGCRSTCPLPASCANRQLRSKRIGEGSTDGTECVEFK